MPAHLIITVAPEAGLIVGVSPNRMSPVVMRSDRQRLQEERAILTAKPGVAHLVNVDQSLATDLHMAISLLRRHLAIQRSRRILPQLRNRIADVITRLAEVSVAHQKSRPHPPRSTAGHIVEMKRRGIRRGHGDNPCTDLSDPKLSMWTFRVVSETTVPLHPCLRRIHAHWRSISRRLFRRIKRRPSVAQLMHGLPMPRRQPVHLEHLMKR
jgi:hypothetical protein